MVLSTDANEAIVKQANSRVSSLEAQNHTLQLTAPAQDAVQRANGHAAEMESRAIALESQVMQASGEARHLQALLDERDEDVEVLVKKYHALKSQVESMQGGSRKSQLSTLVLWQLICDKKPALRAGTSFAFGCACVADGFTNGTRAIG